MNRKFKKFLILTISTIALINITGCSKFETLQKHKTTISNVEEFNESSRESQKERVLEVIKQYFGITINKDDVEFVFGEIETSDSGENKHIVIEVINKNTPYESKNSSLFIAMIQTKDNKMFEIHNFIKSDLQKTTTRDEKKQIATDFLIDTEIVKEKQNLNYTGLNVAMTAMGEYTGFEYDYKGNFLSVGVDNKSGEPIFIFSPDLGLD